MKRIAQFALIFLIIGIIGSFVFNSNVFSMGAKGEGNEEQKVDGSDVEKIELVVDVADVTILPGEGNQIVAHYTGNKKTNVEVTKEGNTVVIETDTSGEGWSWFNMTSLFSFNLGSTSLDVVLPAKVYEKIDLSSNIGDINIERINTKQLIIASDIGEVELVQVASGTASITSNIGDVEVEKGVGAFSIETDTGEIELNVSEFKQDISIESNIGDVEVDFNQPPTNIILDIESDLSDVTVENIEKVKHNLGKAYYVEIGDKGPTLKVRTDIGGIAIK